MVRLKAILGISLNKNPLLFEKTPEKIKTKILPVMKVTINKLQGTGLKLTARMKDKGPNCTLNLLGVKYEI